MKVFVQSLKNLRKSLTLTNYHHDFHNWNENIGLYQFVMLIKSHRIFFKNTNEQKSIIYIILILNEF